MRISIRKKYTKKPPFWKAQYRTFKKSDLKKYKNKGHLSSDKATDFKIDDYNRHGFNLNWSIEQARDRAKQINSQDDIEKRNKAKSEFNERRDEERERLYAFLPKSLVIDFENQLREDFYGTEIEWRKDKSQFIWKKCQKILCDLEIPIDIWGDKKRSFYKYFIKNKISLSYAEKIINMLNKWGRFQSNYQKSYFQELPFPRGRDKTKLIDTYSEHKGRGKESKPLTESLLMKAESRMLEYHFNWLWISFWFGLRPSEVDSLLEEEGDKYKVKTKNKKQYITVYQSKLTSIEKSKRYKNIPIIFPEQFIALELIREKRFKRPLPKTIQNHIGEGFNCYCGRKGFEALLLSLNDSGKITYEMISNWLGHASVDRTWRNYRNRENVLFANIN